MPKPFAGKIIANAPLAIQYCMEAVNHGLDMTLADGLFLEATLFGVRRATEETRTRARRRFWRSAAEFKGKEGAAWFSVVGSRLSVYAGAQGCVSSVGC